MKIPTRCPFENCSSKKNEILGKCKYCDNTFCTVHRFVEAHFCKNISKCYDEKYNDNNIKLMNDKVSSKKLDRI